MTAQQFDVPDPIVATTGKGTGGMEYKIVGSTMQAVICEIDAGESIVSQSGGMAWNPSLSSSMAFNRAAD